MPPKSKIPKAVSSDSICTNVINKEEEVIQEEVTIVSCILPVLLVVLYVIFLVQMNKYLWLDSKIDPETDSYTRIYTIFEHFIGNRKDVFENQEYSDPFKRVWISGPIMSSILYILMVRNYEKYMAKLKPFQIKQYVLVYNIYQCILNIYCVAAMLLEVTNNPHFKGLWGNKAQTSDSNAFTISFLVWVHYNNKYVELLDTVWMVLKKKNDQVSFLHCYHHLLLIWSWYAVCKIDSGGDSYFGATVNSFIHIIMYGYYTMALLKIECPWKKQITNAQMAQFCLCLAHAIYVVVEGNMPIELPLLQGFVMVNMLYLFQQFKIAKYGKKA